jgi:hypothetical protein
MRTYRLYYAPAQGATSTSQLFQLWHHSFLSEIQMEGRCGQFEDSQGNVPENQECSGARLPSTTFEYEEGYPIFVMAAFTKVEGGPLGAADADRVLPYLNSIGVVDFNRDGLPDIVQSWNQEYCPDDLANDGNSKGNNGTNVIGLDQILCDQGFRIGGEKHHVMVPFQSTRPIVGYLNRGVNVLDLNLSYQCMDTGSIDDFTGLTPTTPRTCPRSSPAGAA